ncbi:hypothetical protein [Anaerobium acetethylicum]|nr:hypothetical protein [Anaerobium acetethylicum]
MKNMTLGPTKHINLVLKNYQTGLERSKLHKGQVKEAVSFRRVGRLFCVLWTCIQGGEKENFVFTKGAGMESLINEYVEHKKYGRGIVTGGESGKIEVEFKNGVEKKQFLFPDSFDGFLILDNEVLEAECLLMVQEKKQVLAKEAEEKRLEYKRLKEERRKEKTKSVKKKKSTTKSVVLNS